MSSAFDRQLMKATQILRSERAGENLLNRKSEYSRCLVPALNINWVDCTITEGGTKHHMKKRKNENREWNPEKRFKKDDRRKQKQKQKPETP